MLCSLLFVALTQDPVDIESLSSFTVSGKQSSVLDGYQEAELMSHTGSGSLTHMWFGGSWPGYDKTRLRIYVDGEASPSIDMELGLGHGVGFEDMNAPWGGKKLGRTGAPSGLYNSYRIPYTGSVRITAQRDSESPSKSSFWWIIRGTDGLPVSVAGVRLPSSTRMRLIKLEGHVAQPYEEFDMADIEGPGALYQVTIAARGLADTGGWKSLSYMEAVVRGYFDGSSEPQWLSSGLEDYFLGTYYFQKGRFANDLAGLTHLNADARTFSAYRFHDEDPVFFQQSLRLTCRCGEIVDGVKLHDPPPTEFTTYVWVYTW